MGCAKGREPCMCSGKCFSWALCTQHILTSAVCAAPFLPFPLSLSLHIRNTQHTPHPPTLIPLCNRRKSPYTPRYNASGAKPAKKKGNYWDNVDWEAPLLPFLPDKWYVRVAWLVVIVGSALYLNFRCGFGSS